ncbi:MAG: hypothetical protein KFB93_04905 [Simkaniaceae bacterium]|nr:MAG: hypothetical protein KFB93_04905 [Simkaniaceae bacterium]
MLKLLGKFIRGRMSLTNISLSTLSNSKRALEPLAFMGLAFLAGRERFIVHFGGATPGGFLVAGGLASLFCHFTNRNQSSNSLEKVIALACACMVSSGVTHVLKGRVSLSLKNQCKITMVFLIAHIGIDGVFSSYEVKAARREHQQRIEDGQKLKIKEVLRMPVPPSLIGEGLELSDKGRAALNLIDKVTFLRPDMYLGKDFIHGCESISQRIPQIPEERSYLQSPSTEQPQVWWAHHLMRQIEGEGELRVYITNLRKRSDQEYLDLANILETLANDVGEALKRYQKEESILSEQTRTTYDFS